MKQSRFTAEQITQILREAEPRGSSKTVARKYGSLGSSEVRRIRELEHENSKLKRLVAD